TIHAFFRGIPARRSWHKPCFILAGPEGNMQMRFIFVAWALGLVACGNSIETTAVVGGAKPVGTTPREDEQPVGEITSGLQYGGAIATAPRADDTSVQLSAPLFPDTTVFQRFQQAGVYDA